ncbi:hypothetical protein RFI_06342 [Reticulomyxa filosa]|uniref:Uncharacterized protein n=1 Tax=Reticulomyxa filosa TaxID=46433 RepID=X6NZQ2_RETFI|nr:hypothetical protein RFI_06342 [Reticulomyxa filosa]|eukprot:ETO30777.1 hypothetical protein RFI_06342 [Reticulomyxa filosa]
MLKFVVNFFLFLEADKKITITSIYFFQTKIKNCCKFKLILLEMDKARSDSIEKLILKYHIQIEANKTIKCFAHNAIYPTIAIFKNKDRIERMINKYTQLHIHTKKIVLNLFYGLLNIECRNAMGDEVVTEYPNDILKLFNFLIEVFSNTKYLFLYEFLKTNNNVKIIYNLSESKHQTIHFNINLAIFICSHKNW